MEPGQSFHLFESQFARFRCEFKDEQYATWMPPDNQMGDGKTSLNDKFVGRY